MGKGQKNNNPQPNKKKKLEILRFTQRILSFESHRLEPVKLLVRVSKDRNDISCVGHMTCGENFNVTLLCFTGDVA